MLTIQLGNLCSGYTQSCAYTTFCLDKLAEPMAWPKKHTRRLHVDDREYLWHISGNEIESANPITVGIETGKYFLFIDPYAHEFEITPSNVCAALEWALGEGWCPESGPTRSMAFSPETKEFYWLPDGSKFAYEMASDEANG